MWPLRVWVERKFNSTIVSLALNQIQYSYIVDSATRGLMECGLMMEDGMQLNNGWWFGGGETSRLRVLVSNEYIRGEIIHLWFRHPGICALGENGMRDNELVNYIVVIT